MEWTQVWVLMVMVAGNISPVGYYSTQDKCEQAAIEWMRPYPRTDGKPPATSTGRSHKCIPAEIAK